ncbi:hypothetical protein QAD02_013361 [Eretmocerus hayati]|uniref:Uncharacterized protein n=1 Tax=Eretmocerus hayati TaxID=131215 RepID=A0ACC2P1X7_9HYME|nr:hypothetical protein QAD02_013361 [Eretmocerus hayati]
MNASGPKSTSVALLKLLTHPEKEVSDVLPINDDILFVSWRCRKEAVIPAPHTNVVIAAYTTAQARLVLYNYLERLGDRILYADTDSCLFLCRGDDGEYEPPLGSLLGDMTDELQGYGQGAYISKFLSIAPKSYAYRVVVPSREIAGEPNVFECCKVKGITLNSENSLKINLSCIEKLLEYAFHPGGINDGRGTGGNRSDHNTDQNDDDGYACNGGQNADCINLNFRAIRRIVLHEVVTRNESKTCSVVLKKRRYLSKSKSVPFGYSIRYE